MIRALAAALAELVLPLECAGCGCAGYALCPSCRPGVPRWARGAELPTACGGDYAGGLRTAVLRYKERGRRDLARPLGAVLGSAVRLLLGEDGRGPVAVVPVPSSAAAVRARGFDHVDRLAHCAALPVGARIVRALRLSRRVADSAGLSAAARAANLDGAMVALPQSCRRPAVVVDDVTTSGATLREAVRALTAAGWPVLGAAVVAATPRRYPVGQDLGVSQPGPLPRLPEAH